LGKLESGSEQFPRHNAKAQQKELAGHSAEEKPHSKLGHRQKSRAPQLACQSLREFGIPHRVR